MFGMPFCANKTNGAFLYGNFLSEKGKVWWCFPSPPRFAICNFQILLSYQKHKICYFTNSLRGGAFRVKVPQKRGGSDSPAPLNGLGFHPKTPYNNQIIQTTDCRNVFKQKTENKLSAKKLTFAERVKGRALVVCGVWGNRNPHVFPTAFTLKAVPAEQKKNYDNLFLIW